jgi:hypothetical protein
MIADIILDQAAEAPIRMGKIQTPPSIKNQKFTGMVFETSERKPIIPMNIDKPFFVPRVIVK